MSNAPTISILVVTYNHEAYIGQCLDSILMQQTAVDFEIIVGEDCSSDNTRKICEDYAQKYPDKIRLFLRSREDVIYINGRPTGRFNMIQNLKAAKGDYIAVIEGDDYWTDPHKLQKQLDFLKNNEQCSLCCHAQVKELNGDRIADPRTDNLKDGGLYKASDLFAFQLQPQLRTVFFKNCLSPQEIEGDFFRTSIYGDFALCFMLAKYGQIGFVDEVMAVYRLHEQGYAARSLKTDMDYANSRLELVKIWCQARAFSEVDRAAFKKGVMKLYGQVIARIGRKKALTKTLIHWNKMSVPLWWSLDISFSLKRKILFNS